MKKTIALISQINPFDIKKQADDYFRSPVHPALGVFNCHSDIHPKVLAVIKKFSVYPTLRDISARLQELMGVLEIVYPFIEEVRIQKDYSFDDIVSYSVVGEVEYFGTVDLHNWEMHEGLGYKGFSYMTSHEIKICIDQMLRRIHSLSVDSPAYKDMKILIDLTRVRYEGKYMQEKEYSPFVKPVV